MIMTAPKHLNIRVHTSACLSLCLIAAVYESWASWNWCSSEWQRPINKWTSDNS